SPSWNVTVPVGVPAPGATAATVAVKVTAWPGTAGVTDHPRATVGAARLTVTSGAPVLAAEPPVAAEEAGSAGRPPASDPPTVAWPASLPWAVPRTGVPSRKVTVPAGPPAWELTLAVSNTVCPKTAVGADVPSVVVVFAAVNGAELFSSTPTV